MTDSAQGTGDLAQEGRWVRRAAAGDPEAFARLYDAYVDRVYRFVFFRVDDQATAEDLTSQVFLKAWERLDGYEERGNPFGAWLFRVARNAVIDHVRARKPTDPLEDRTAVHPDPAPAVDARIDSESELNRLKMALAELTEEQALVLTLKFIEDQSTEEVAAFLGKSAGAVRALQMRGLHALAEVLERHE